MGFEGLLGNGRLKENLRISINRGHISHFYLISGPEGSGKKTLARLLSAAIHCKSQDKPCLSCPACRKVMANTHPDVITVTDPEHKNVAVKIVRQMRDDMFIRPNEGDWKIYLFPQSLGIEGQNALLKVLEEPPKYGVMMLLADNPEALLPTIRSRCTELKLIGLESALLERQLREDFPNADPADIQAAASRSGGYLGQARQMLEAEDTATPQTAQFVDSFIRRDSVALLSTLVTMDRWKRDQLIPVLEQWVQLLSDALLYRSGVQAVCADARNLAQSRSSQEIMEAIRQLRNCIEYARGNVSVSAIIGHLTWALR